jgi:hypothetical protein
LKLGSLRSLLALAAASIALDCAEANAASGQPEWLLPLPGPLPALHPTEVMCLYKDHPCKLIGVSGSYGVIDDRGNRVHVLSSASYNAARANSFLPGSIAIKTESAVSYGQVRKFANTNDPTYRPVDSTYEATVVASQAYAGCYLVLLFFDQRFLDGRVDNPSISIAFQNIGDLPAGIETKVSAVFHYVDYKKTGLVYLPLYFSNGVEILTDQLEGASRLFRCVDMQRHKMVMDAYLQKNPHSTIRALPYLRFPPVFPGGLVPGSIPADLKVDFTVNADGTVDGVQLSKTVRTDVLVGIRRAIQGWLYVPALQAGFPQSSSVSMLLDFKN